MAFRVPVWFAPRAMGEDQAALAEALERRVLSEVSAAHPFGTPWTLTVSAPECEAWLNTRLPVWLENQNTPRPSWLGFVGVSFTARRAAIAGATRPDNRPPVVSFEFACPIEPGASPSLEARLGTLPVPRWVVVALVPGLHQQFDRALGPGTISPTAGSGGTPQGIATIRLDDGRRVRVRRVESGTDTLTLHCTTIARAEKKR